MEYPIMIEITGYVTETHRKARFMIKITNDNIEDEKGNHPGVSKEKSVFIPGALYPNDSHEQFESAKDNEYLIGKIDECWSRSKELKMGDQVKCCVFIVTTTGDEYDGNRTFNIHKNPNDIETYTKFELWLYPDIQLFERLEVDSRESLKFRKQWRYTSINREKYKKITGSTLYGYRDKKWVNKNPKITFPILWGIQVKTTVSNLWKRLTGQENLPIISLIANIILAFISIISIAVNIWLLFLKGQ